MKKAEWILASVGDRPRLLRQPARSFLNSAFFIRPPALSLSILLFSAENHKTEFLKGRIQKDKNFKRLKSPL